MARTNNLDNFLTDIADAIRNKAGTQAPIPASAFDTAIRNIPSGSLPTNWHSVTSLEAMENISSPQSGDMCIVNEETLTDLIPWRISAVSDATESNVFHFPQEVDISDIEDEVYSQFGDVLNFAVESVGIPSLASASILINIKTTRNFTFSLWDENNNDKLIVQYTYDNNRHLFVKNNAYIQFNNSEYELEDAYNCYVTRYAYSINCINSGSEDRNSVNELLGRFIKTKNYVPFSKKRKSHSFYFPRAFLIDEEPLHIDSDGVITMSAEGSFDEARICLWSASGIANRIEINSSDGGLLYYWIDNGYYLITNSCSTSNSYFTLSEKDVNFISDDYDEDFIQRLIHSGLIFEATYNIPSLYIYTNNRWEKYSKGKNYQC